MSRGDVTGGIIIASVVTIEKEEEIQFSHLKRTG